MAVGNELELALRIRALVEGQQGIVDLGESFIDINKRIETLVRGLTAITGSTEGAQRELEYLKGVADSSGLAILDLADNYIKLTASAKGTNLEGEATRTVFESVSNAMAVLGGDTITTHRAFNALAQMMSKGQIYSEELKGQLAEAIPGALQIMSRALGISTKDMLALMEAGRLSSDALLPFAEQLNKEFGLFATTSTTFVQAINRIKNTWVELMTRIGDTGVWNGITSAIDGLASKTDYVAGFLGAGLGLAIQKITISTKEFIKSTYDSIVASKTQATAAEQNAVANLSAAQAKVSATQAILNAALAEERLALADRAAAVTITQRTAAEQRLVIAQTERVIAEKAAYTAIIQQESAQKSLIASQGLLARAWGVFTGPVGMFALMVAGIVSMISVFGDQDEATKNLTKSTDEYKDSLDKLSSIQLSSSVASSNKAIESKKEEIAVTQDLIGFMDAQSDYVLRLGSLYDALVLKLRFWVSDEDKRRETLEKLSIQENDLIKLELQRALTMDEVRNRYPELLQKEEEEIQKVKKLTAERNAAKNTYLSLIDGYYLGKVSIDELSLAYDRYIQKEKELSAEQKRAKNVTEELAQSQKAYAEITGLNEEQIKGIITVGEEYIKTMDTEGQAIARKVQSLVALTKEQKAHAAELKQLKIEGESLEKVEKARIDTLIRQANAIGVLAQQRQANIDKANAEVALSEQQEVILKKELDVLEENLRIQKESASFKTSNEEKTKKEISDTEALITKKKGEIAARESNTAALRTEATAIELSNTLISNTLNNQKTDLANARAELTELLDKYQRFKDWGSDPTAIELMLQRIRDKTKEIIDRSNEMQKTFSIAAKQIGLDWDELMTGMDFKTKQTIDTIKSLASEGVLTGNQLRESLSRLINSADTQTEIEAVISLLRDLQNEGKLTGVNFDEFAGLIRERMRAVAGDTSFDDIKKKIELIGSASLNNISIQERVLNAQKAETQASADLAKQKGYEYEARQGIIKVAEIEAKLASLNADRKIIEANAAIQIARAIQDEIQSRTRLGEIISDIDRNRMQSAQNAINIAVIESNAANSVAELARRKMEDTKNASVETKQATDSVTHGFVEQTLAAEENAQALERAGKITAGIGLLQKQLTEYLNGARERMDELSASARLYFEAMLEGTLAANAIQGAAQGSLAATQAWTNATREGSDELAKFAGEIANASRQMGAARQDLLFAADDMRVWISAISLSEAATKKAFYEQATDAENLRLRIHDLAESGRLDMATLTMAEQEAQNGFKLLDNEDLANLRSEIDAAKQKLEEMQQATEDARTRLSELNAELLESQGQDQKAELLRQQLDYETRLAEIERQRQEAELLGNRELVTILDKQAAVLRQINEAKVASIQADADTEQTGDKVANSWSRAEAAIRSTGAALGEVHSLGIKVAEIDLSGLRLNMTDLATQADRLRSVL